MKIIANLKMNKTVQETKEYLTTIVSKYNKKHELTLCLPYTSLALGQFFLEGNEFIKMGAQNVCDEEVDKCTGEISAQMLKSAGTHSVIVGHSERKVKFRETGRSINKKIKLALKNGLQVILCVGENLAERNSKKTKESLKDQLEDCLKGLYENELENITIAYEPVWAIGTGKIPLMREIEQSIKYIRKNVVEYFSQKAGDEIKVVYGGSVNNKNVLSIIRIPGVDGVLIGGACLDANNFLQLLSILPN